MKIKLHVYKSFLFFALLSILFISCKVESNEQGKAKPAVDIKKMRIEKKIRKFEDTIFSKAIEGNLLNDSPERSVYIQLPPSYYESDRQYPVVYFLNGYYQTVQTMKSVFSLIDLYVENKPGLEFIFVSIDGYNSRYGSFYANSPVTGNWEDFVVKEVIQHVDTNYRTKAHKDSRALIGFSMGGGAAFNIGFKYPDVYSVVYIMCGALLKKKGLNGMFRDTDENFKLAYGSSFAPEIENKEAYCTLPKFNNSKEDNELIKRWESGFGHIDQKIDAYLLKKDRLRSIIIFYADNDQFKFVSEGSKYLTRILKRKRIKHNVYTEDVAHEPPPDFIKDHLLVHVVPRLK